MGGKEERRRTAKGAMGAGWGGREVGVWMWLLGRGGVELPPMRAEEKEREGEEEEEEEEEEEAALACSMAARCSR